MEVKRAREADRANSYPPKWSDIARDIAIMDWIRGGGKEWEGDFGEHGACVCCAVCVPV